MNAYDVVRVRVRTLSQFDLLIILFSTAVPVRTRVNLVGRGFRSVLESHVRIPGLILENTSMCLKIVLATFPARVSMTDSDSEQASRSYCSIAAARAQATAARMCAEATCKSLCRTSPARCSGGAALSE